MKLADLKIGMLISGMQRRFDYQVSMRVEFVAHDWAIARCDDNSIRLLRHDDTFELPKTIGLEDA